MAKPRTASPRSRRGGRPVAGLGVAPPAGRRPAGPPGAVPAPDRIARGRGAAGAPTSVTWVTWVTWVTSVAAVSIMAVLLPRPGGPGARRRGTKPGVDRAPWRRVRRRAPARARHRGPPANG